MRAYVDKESLPFYTVDPGVTEDKVREIVQEELEDYVPPTQPEADPEP